MKLAFYNSKQGLIEEIPDDDPRFDEWAERCPPGWSNGYVWVKHLDDDADAAANVDAEPGEDEGEEEVE